MFYLQISLTLPAPWCILTENRLPTLGDISQVYNLHIHEKGDRHMQTEQMAIRSILAQVRKAVRGKDQVLARVLLSILAQGHILLEDIPGVGKTTMALAFSKALGLRCQRVQFTPDVMPSDLTGFSVYHRERQGFEYQPGALMCNLFLADELNRATSRTQSALLEAMEEGQVTVDGVSRPIPQPFVVIATQNPVGAAGTQPLPDSQLDRFTIRLSLGYPSHQAEFEMVRDRQGGNPLSQVEQAVDHAGLAGLRRAVSQVHVSDDVLNYLLELIEATRRDPQILQGASPRATLALTHISQAMALASDRDYVIPEDVQAMFYDVIAHRLIFAPRAAETPQAQKELMARVMQGVKAPRLR